MSSLRGRRSIEGDEGDKDVDNEEDKEKFLQTRLDLSWWRS